MLGLLKGWLLRACCGVLYGAEWVASLMVCARAELETLESTCLTGSLDGTCDREDASRYTDVADATANNVRKVR